MVDPAGDPLGAELRELGDRLQVPEAPDLRAAVRSRLTAPPAGSARTLPWAAAVGRHRVRRWLVAAVAALACTVAVVPPARAAVVDAVGGLLRFAGVDVRRDGPDAGSLPSSPAPLPSTRAVNLEEARRLARFPVGVPAALGAPEQILIADPGPDGAPRVVSMTFKGGAVRFDQFDGELDGVFLKTAQGAEWVQVGGRTGLWFRAPHPLTYRDRTGATRVEAARLAGPTLIWTDGTVSYRLEGVATLPEAIAAAASVR